MQANEEEELIRDEEPDYNAPRRILVKFQDKIGLPYVDGVETYIQEQGLAPWDEIAAAFPGITLMRKFISLSADEITALVNRASQTDPEYRPPDFLTFFVIDMPEGIEPAALVEVLTTLEIVEYTYIESLPTPSPAINAINDVQVVNQGYLNPGPDGINAKFSWGVAGGEGNGIQFIDMEQGWGLNSANQVDHEDLIGANIQLLSGVNKLQFSHGTAVLGIVMAQDNDKGCVGIAPSATASVVSTWRTAAATTPNYGDAMLSVLPLLGLGDVLLAETQIELNGQQYLPIELEPANFETIRLTTALGVTVIEAAGNGRQQPAPAPSGPFNLDNQLNTIGEEILNRNNGKDFRDSGAIMIGAATALNIPGHIPRQRLQGSPPPGSPEFSNFGSRVDCYAWGEQVTTTSVAPLYIPNFDGTSSAAAIIAGAAVAVQGIVKPTPRGPFSPRQLRALFTHPAVSTPSNNPAVDRIGVMPNLQAIIQVRLNIVPDIYLRDFVGDGGTVHNGPISSSSDVILRQTQVPNPQAYFGPGSGRENSATEGEAARIGQSNYIYVRVLNRGGSNASNVTATVYWSPVATLVRPDLWTEIGSTTIANVVPGNVLTVSNGIHWPAAAIPAAGHYCFVALLDHPQDPAGLPPIGPGGPGIPPGFQSFDNFYNFIRRNNNVTWRNFNVISRLRALALHPLRLPFLITGAAEEDLEMRLEIFTNLPDSAYLRLEGPPEFLQSMLGDEVQWEEGNQPGTIRVALHVNKQNRLYPQIFAAGAAILCQLLVRLPEASPNRDDEIVVRQLYQEEEVGRITWLLQATPNNDDWDDEL